MKKSVKRVLTIGGCAIGGIVAAPFVATAAVGGLIAGGGAAALTAAEAIVFASSATIGTAGAVTGAAVGGAISKSSEKKKKRFEDEYLKGFKAASEIFEEKIQKMETDFLNDKNEFEKNREEYKQLFDDMNMYISKLENDLKTSKSDSEKTREELDRMKQMMETIVRLKIDLK